WRGGGIFAQWCQLASVILAGITAWLVKWFGVCADIVVGASGQPGAGVAFPPWRRLGIAAGYSAANTDFNRLYTAIRATDISRAVAAAETDAGGECLQLCWLCRLVHRDESGIGGADKNSGANRSAVYATDFSAGV